MDITALQPSPKAANIPLESLAGNKSLSEPEKIAEVSRQFESMLLRQVLKDGRKPLLASSKEQNSTSAGIYSDMINNQLADSISRSGTLGLAQSLQGQLVHQALPHTPDENQPGKLAAATAKSIHFSPGAPTQQKHAALDQVKSSKAGPVVPGHPPRLGGPHAAHRTHPPAAACVRCNAAGGAATGGRAPAHEAGGGGKPARRPTNNDSQPNGRLTHD